MREVHLHEAWHAADLHPMTPGWHVTMQGKLCERPPAPGKGFLHVRGMRQSGLLPCRASYVEGRLRLAESRERQRVKGASTRGQPAAVGAAAPVGKAAPVTAQASEEERAAAEKAANANMAKLLEEEDALKVCCQGLKVLQCPTEKRLRPVIPLLVEPSLGFHCLAPPASQEADCPRLAAVIPALHRQH